MVKRIRNGLISPDDGETLIENEVVLLVVDNEADDYYKKLNIIVRHDSESVIKLSTQLQQPVATGQQDANNNNLDKNNNNITSTEKKANNTAAVASQLNNETNKLNTSNSASTSSLASSAKSISATNHNQQQQQDSLISNSTSSNTNQSQQHQNNSSNVNHDEILPVEEKKLDKNAASTSSTSNLSLNLSNNDYQSKSSKVNGFLFSLFIFIRSDCTVLA